MKRQFIQFSALLAATAMGITAFTFLATIGFLTLSAFGVVAAPV